jgi:hypothetical protein
VAIWSEDSILKHQDRLVDVAEITKLPKATEKRTAKVVQPPSLVRVAIWSVSNSSLKHHNGSVDIPQAPKLLKAMQQGTGERA